MTRAGDCLVRCCTSLHNTPAAVLCVLLSAVQMASLDYYLVSLLSHNHLGWLAADVAQHVLRRQQKETICDLHSLAWASWLLMSVIVCAKVSVLINCCVEDLEEEADTFWGPNTLKTSVALGACTFLLLLMTQHDAAVGSESRRYIEELTGTVVFDILDTVEILDILLEPERSQFLWKGLEETILAVAVVNLLLPAVPLFTLSCTQFGRKKLHKRLVYLHRILGVVVVNVPNLVVRMLLWHGHNMGVSPFTLKNVVLILMTSYEFYEHKKMKYEMHEQEKLASKKRHANERRFTGGSFNEHIGEDSTKQGCSFNTNSIARTSSQMAVLDLDTLAHSKDKLYDGDFGLETRVASI
ncbi:cat eye syndrome critical region protein 6-like protein [Plakobranchus ocellatus]|uniref:Cat eye syndrome critical region protein 6-like protein n=1 Tax=Plakobranchus ocellatus TaxID=259542 RepID=A0AAV4BDV0_9GAST|nr:cat eye syndrome critical region protein 6-like protein [Plakobranchus ocellatus]